MTIRFQGQLDQTLYRRAQRINGARATTTLFTAFGLFVFAALFGFFLPWLGWTLLGLGVLALVLLALVEWQIRKNWKTHKLGQEPFQGALSEEGLEVVAPHGSIKAGWDRFHAWKGTASELLIYQSSALFHILARRFFASDDDWS
ncbi:MAG: YcxB family protein, partial [Candidatus Rokuibacteriota bacterium]